MKMHSRRMTIISLLLISFLILGSSVSYAVEDEMTEGDVREDIPVEPIDDYVVIDAVESSVESNFTSKEYYIEGDDRNNYLVEGGNEEAVNMMATEQSTAGGTLTENSDIEGKAYDMALPTEEDFETKDPLELRQFITFETKSGKEFHIIIDHGEDADNVRMLTEVSEQDLLNMIEAQADVEIALIEDEVELPQDESLKEPEKKEVDSEEQTPASTEDPVDYSMIIIGAVAGVSGIAGWYFKIIRPKSAAAYEDEIDEADYIDDDELINEDY